MIHSSLLILSHWLIYHSVLPLVNLTIKSGIILSKISLFQLAAMKPLQIFIIAVVLLPIQLQRTHYYKNSNNFSKLRAVLQDAVIEAIDIAEANRQLWYQVTGGLIFVSYHRDHDSISIIKSGLSFVTVSSTGRGGESRRHSNSSPRAGFTFVAEEQQYARLVGN